MGVRPLQRSEEFGSSWCARSRQCLLLLLGSPCQRVHAEDQLRRSCDSSHQGREYQHHQINQWLCNIGRQPEGSCLPSENQVTQGELICQPFTKPLAPVAETRFQKRMSDATEKFIRSSARPMLSIFYQLDCPKPDLPLSQ